MADQDLDRGFVWDPGALDPIEGGSDGAWPDDLLPTDDGGGNLPPVEPPDDEPSRQPSGPWRGPAPVGDDGGLVGHGATAAILLVWGGLFLAQFVAVLFGARGGWAVVALSTSLFIVFFCGPIVVGGWWLSRLMEQGRRDTAWMRQPSATPGASSAPPSTGRRAESSGSPT
jgi:hypothetical protein